MAFRLLEHTADVAIEATGPDAGTALAEAGTALASLVLDQADPCGLVAPEPLDLSVVAPDLPALAVAFLGELLWHLESEDLLWVRGTVEVVREGSGRRATARGHGLRLGPEAHGQGVEVKAVTYHDLVFEEAPLGWRLHVLLDV